MTWPAKKCNCVTTKQEQEVSSIFMLQTRFCIRISEFVAYF